MQGGLTPRRALALTGLAVALILVALWWSGGLAGLRHWAEAAAREVQRDLAGAVRAIATGQRGALAGLLAISFGYGFFHAVGPGHGKLLIGGYGLARRVPLLRLAGLALASSLAQATVAVGLVYGFVLALGWARTRLVAVNDAVFLPLSSLAVAGIGLWLVVRGLRGLRRPRQAGAEHPDHSHHDHDHDADCGCGHAHGPTLQQAEAVTGWHEAATLVAGIALRPCSGALFLLIVSWQMGIALAGIVGVYAMGLGTALVTIAVAGLSVWAREGIWAAMPQALSRVVPVIELTVGLLVTALAGQVLLAAI